MTNYKFIKDYKSNDLYRQSFCRLAKKTFGINFEDWYEEGFWNDNYVCYSYLKDDEVIANVSLSTMELIMAGERHKAIQIGTVMTDPEYRRQGLAFELLSKVLEDYDNTYNLYFLAADDEAVPLYKRCGFSYREENKYIIELKGYKLLDKPLKPVDILPQDLLAIKNSAKPLSNVLSAIGDEYILMFYYNHGFKSLIHNPMEEVYVIFEIKDDTLHLYDILSKKDIKLQQLIEAIAHQGVKQVFCHFTPDPEIKNLRQVIDDSSNWMQRSRGGISFPNQARFPRISQT